MDSGPGEETLPAAVAECDLGAFRTLYERHAGGLAIPSRPCASAMPAWWH